MNKVGSVKEADLILKGKEKEAYLEFLESGGFAHMRANLIEQTERNDKHYKELDETYEKAYSRLKEYEVIYEVINKLDWPGYDHDNGKWHDTISELCGLEDHIKTNYHLGYTKVFENLYKYLKVKKKGMTLEEKFNKQYKLLHENLAEDKRLMKIEYKQKLVRWQSTFWRRVFKKLFS